MSYQKRVKGTYIASFVTRILINERIGFTVQPNDNDEFSILCDCKKTLDSILSDVEILRQQLIDSVVMDD